MNAIKVETTIDEAVARAIPALRPLLGTRVEIIALQADAVGAQRRRLTLDELLASRLERPPGVAPVTLDDMERAIVEGALTFAMGYPYPTSRGVGRIVGLPFIAAYFDAAGRDYLSPLMLPAVLGNGVFWGLFPQIVLAGYVVARRRRG
jgi:hypothetical protein